MYVCSDKYNGERGHKVHTGQLLRMCVCMYVLVSTMERGACLRSLSSYRSVVEGCMHVCIYVCVDKYNGERGLPAVTKFIQVSY